jgi:hypothetical protein
MDIMSHITMMTDFLDSRNEKWLAMESAHDRVQVCGLRACALGSRSSAGPRRPLPATLL